MKTSVSPQRSTTGRARVQGRNHKSPSHSPARTRVLPVVALKPDALAVTRGAVVQTLERVSAGFTEGCVNLGRMAKSLGGVYEYGLTEERWRIDTAGMLLALQFKELAEAEAAGRLTLDHPAYLDLCTRTRKAVGALLSMGCLLERHASFAVDAGRFVALATDLQAVLEDITNALKVRYGVARAAGGAR